ncbi:hypothetical protein B0A48_14608 [Cryoendolithus antarcticus]|uniref:Heterokaryon incompatibility domain-containing protein n=1 Tax=Cryoendolithus antarcticus TaxID=1507870 RepID=A0A1V8SL35_9PEZI|nr:hypothetical protein B0A48_14608 [Cryoendolithus antarcticus]
MAANLVYRPLAAKDFRLLHVMPGKGSQPLCAHLRHVTLSDRQRLAYETISYAWGDPTPAAEVLVNDLPVLVPAKTEAVLKRVRLLDIERVVWIDAVCINQDDILERSAQVVLMGSIYAGSVRNLVFLGMTNDDMAFRVLRTIETINQDARLSTDDFKSLGVTLGGDGPTRQYSATRFTFEVDGDALIALLELPLLRRLWIVQEVVLAPQNLAFLGSIELELLDILRAVRWFFYKESTMTMPPAAVAGGNCCARLVEFVDREHGAYAGQSIGLTDLLQCGQSFEKTESRDGVFAFLGLLPQDQVSHLQPDYTKPLAEVLAIATRAAIEGSRRLSLFSTISHRGDELESSGIPSWAVRVDRESDDWIDGESLPTYFPPSGHLGEVQSVEWEDTDIMILPLQGIIVGVVVEATPPCCKDISLLSKFFTLSVDLYKAAAADESFRVSLRALAETLMAGLSANGSRADSCDIDTMEKLLTCITEPGQPTEQARAMSDAAARCWISKVVNHCVFFTEQGSPGLGPQVMRKGDTVAVLRGAPLPVILRGDSQGCHQLVGPAYLHGIMEGEAEVMLDSMRGRETIFKLI